MPAPLNPHRVRLAGRLRALRAASGQSGNRFAQQLGWQQSRVSKIETGKQLPTEADLDAWVQATRATRDDAEELAELLAAARVEYATWREISRRSPRGLADQQATYRESEAVAQHIAEYQPAMIPGIVQTPAYARELLLLPGGPTSQGMSTADVEAVVAERVRRQEILYQPARLIQIIVGEAALYNAPGAIETMRGQLDRLITVAGLATVDLRVLPRDTNMPVAPIAGFSLEDDTVYYESLTGEHRLHEPEEVGVYRQAFEALLAATERQDPIEHLRHAIEELKKRG